MRERASAHWINSVRHMHKPSRITVVSPSRWNTVTARDTLNSGAQTEWEKEIESDDKREWNNMKKATIESRRVDVCVCWCWCRWESMAVMANGTWCTCTWKMARSGRMQQCEFVWTTYFNIVDVRILTQRRVQHASNDSIEQIYFGRFLQLCLN